MRILTSGPASIAKLLDTSIKLYAASFSKLWGFMLAAVALNMASGLLMQPFTDKQHADVPSGGHLLLIVVGILFASIAVLTLYAAMIYRVDRLANQHEGDGYWRTLQIGFKKIPSMFWAGFLYSLATLIGLILLVIPGVALMLSLSFYTFFIVVESLGGYAALKASYALVKGFWWRTVGVFMAPGILFVVFYFALGLVAAVIMAIFKGNGGMEGAKLIVQLIYNVLSGFITPYFFVLGYVQYHDLKLRKSGVDLELRLAK